MSRIELRKYLLLETNTNKLVNEYQRNSPFIVGSLQPQGVGVVLDCNYTKINVWPTVSSTLLEVVCQFHLEFREIL